MALSEKLYSLRKKSGLSQEQLAEKLNVSRQAVSKWETGQSVPESDKLVAISDFFDVSLDYLMKDDEKKKAPADSREPIANSIIGIIMCMAGAVGMVVWGLLSLFSPATSEQISESSVIRIDGNGIFLILCAAVVVVGAVLSLRKNAEK